jgi:hypothetical protein
LLDSLAHLDTSELVSNDEDLLEFFAVVGESVVKIFNLFLKVAGL